MAVYTTFFAATASELHAAFPGWLEPLRAPVRKTSVNPFTKKPVTYDSWEPEEVFSSQAALSKISAPTVVAIKGDYQAYLQGRLPKGVHALPHLAAKSVLSPHVEQLVAVVASRDKEALRPALFATASMETNATLDRLPTWGVDALANVDDGTISRLGDTLATSEGWFSDEGWKAADCAWLVRELRRVALEARARGGDVYLLTEA